MTRRHRDDLGASSLESLILGSSPAVRRLRALVERLAPTSLSVLIEGPTGAGKELVAQALHVISGRPGRFVPFNVCAIGDGVFEDALFGHARGAFTGALSDRAGFLEEAHGGTVFLDEIGGMPLAAQAKLLRAVETRVFRPVGGRADRQSDFRLIAATNVAITDLVARGGFRADLSFRLGGFTIRVPSLRERPEDVGPLAEHFLALADPSGVRRFSASALSALAAHDWPGNVRELKHAIERAVLLSTTLVIGRDEIAQSLADRPQHPLSRPSFMERRMLDVLEAVAWDIDEAARQLGVHRTTVYRRLRQMQGRGTRRDGPKRPDTGTSVAPSSTTVARNGATDCN